MKLTILGLELKTWLGLTVVGSVVSTLGALIGILLKDFYFTRSFERWKQDQALEQLYQKYRDPLALSACELGSRVVDIVQQYPTVYLHASVLASNPERQIANTTDDPYFRRYRLVSTVFRFCAFLGWIELYRQEITHLHSGSHRHSQALEESVERIREDLADGQLNAATDWEKWRDTLIFREELRAVGESMIETRGGSRTVIGYGRFAELFDAQTASATQRWARVVVNFLLDLEDTKLDFRRMRLQRLVVHLVGVIELLAPQAIDANLMGACDRLRKELELPQ